MDCIKASKKGKKKGKMHTKACKNGLHKEQAHKTIHRQQNKIIDNRHPTRSTVIARIRHERIRRDFTLI
jgi:hypothetical protein